MQKRLLLCAPVVAPLAALRLLATALLLVPVPRHAHAQAGTGAGHSSYPITQAQPE